MRVRLIRVPYDAGNRGLRMGAGPGRLAAAAEVRGAAAAGAFPLARQRFAAPDGLTPAEVQGAIHAIAAARPICSASVAAYDPSADPEGRALDAGLRLIDLLADLAG